MKKYKLLILIALLLAICPMDALAEQITHTVTYEPSKLSIAYDTIVGNVYARAKYDDFNSYNYTGQPELPFDLILLSVPFNATNFSVHFDESQFVNININANVYPSQEPRAISDTTVYKFTPPDSLTYNTSSFYPLLEDIDVSYGYLFGSNKIVSIALRPVLYNPVTGVLRLYTSLTFRVNYSINSQLSPQIFRNETALREYEQNLTASCVKNGADVATNSYEPINTPSLNAGNNNETLPTYKYCIITNRELEPGFKKIIAMKRQKGISAGIVCIEDLMTSSICNGGDINIDEFGDTISVITDSAGVVRKYLKYAYKSQINPTSFVLMGGKAPFAPIRFLHATTAHNKKKHHIPSDLYFNDLSQIWIKNDLDSIFGDEYVYSHQFFYDYHNNYSEHYIHISPDVFVGRLLCKNLVEIDNYSDKLHKYVFNPGNGNYSYLLRALFASNVGFDCTYVKRHAKYIYGEQINEIHEDKTNNSPTGSQFVDSLNISKYGLISIHTHGEPQSISLFNDGLIEYHLTALDRYQPNPQYNMVDENNNGLDCLNNIYEPSICYSIACTTNPFDDAHNFNEYTLMEYKYNMGESFTLGEKYGGPAFLGNTRPAYLDGFDLEKAFYKCMYQKRSYSIGIAELLSKCDTHFTAENQNKYAHNLIGDPEFEMWTSEPRQYNNIFIERTQLGFIIHGVSENDTLAYCDNNGHQGRITTHNEVAYLMDISPNSSVMIYNHDHIPYLIPLMLQNCNINNSQYVYASSFSAGKSIVPNLIHGNVTIKNSAVYEVEATDDVHLGEGFIVENGATFAIKTPGKVTIDGCVFQSGAKVKIEAGSVEIIKSFTAEHSAKVEIINYTD